ncbi:MAG TPA: hypothetical protein VMF66_13700 [Candidatus Acidoferrum sp.]|nr:hypothetical protein [Candidatus Acidoferrum sp.]
MDKLEVLVHELQEQLAAQSAANATRTATPGEASPKVAIAGANTAAAAAPGATTAETSGVTMATANTPSSMAVAAAASPSSNGAATVVASTAAIPAGASPSTTTATAGGAVTNAPAEIANNSGGLKANTASGSTGVPGMQGQAPQTTVAMAEHPTYPSLQIRGFDDVDFSSTDQKGTLSGFNLGQFVLHFSSALSPKVSVFAETSFTPQPEAPYKLEVERIIIRYDYNDNFKLSFGRYHTPINYWNTAFHHGLWLQTTISRPQMIEFGGTFLPVHFVGALAEGSIPSGGLGLNYDIGVGNGRSSNISLAGDAGDVNNNRAWLANIYSRPTRFYGLQVGASGYRDEITLANGRNYREWISSANLEWLKETPEFIAELANVNHQALQTGLVYNSQAFYVQVADRLPWFEKEWKPYYRFEYIHIPQGEPVFVATLQDLVGSTFGVRYDITSYAAFKAEYRYTKQGVNEPFVNGVFFQTAFVF